MRINTKTGKVELLKQEQECLDKAYVVLTRLAKHGDGELEDAASEASGGLEKVIQVLKGVPEVEMPY